MTNAEAWSNKNSIDAITKPVNTPLQTKSKFEQATTAANTLYNNLANSNGRFHGHVSP